MSASGARTVASAPVRSQRDPTVDLARVVCVLVVVVAHLLQTGVGTGAGGSLVASRPLELEPWFPAATWIGQIMPLFFVVGGFAASNGWRSWTRRGGVSAGYIRNRTLRLAQPAVPLFLFFVLVLSIAGLLALPHQLVDDAATGAGSPLWFLAAYLICQVATPFMLRLHARVPVATLVVLGVGVVAIDAARYSTGITDIGLVNLIFVWLLVFQFGFWYADGWFDRRHPLVLIAIAVGCYASLWPLTQIGPYHVNMLDNLNPPTLPLVLLGLAQACILRLANRPLSALMRVRIVRGFVSVVGSRLMTVYLWHLPVILFVTGLTLLVPGAAPAPGTAAWWWSRAVVFVVALGVLYLLSLALSRWEIVGDLGGVPPGTIVAIGVVLAFIPPFAAMQRGLNLSSAITGAVCLTLAVLLLRRWPARAAQQSPGSLNA